MTNAKNTPPLFVAVPREATQAMLDAGYWPCTQGRGAKSVWAEMLRAAPGSKELPSDTAPPPEQATPAADLVAEGREALAAHLHKLIDEYWDLAYREGQENRTQDTKDGAAGRCLHEIQHTIKLLATHPAEASAQGGEIGWPPPFEMRLCEQNHVILKPNRVYVFTVDQECDECRRLAAACDPAAFVGTPAPPPAPERAEPHPSHRWNVEPTERGYKICRGEHDKGDDCNWEYLVPESAAPQAAAQGEADK